MDEGTERKRHPCRLSRPDEQPDPVGPS